MTSAYRFAAALICLSSLLLPWTVQAQVFPRGNGVSLTDLYQTDLYVNVSDWIDMPDEAATFRLDTQRALERELSSAGITRQPSGRHYLVCNVQALTDGTRVTYTAAAELWNLRSTGVHTLLWKDGALASVEQERFNADAVAGDCARYFLAEWSRWNGES